MHDTPFNRILLAAVLVLTIGEGYLLYQNSQLRTAASPAGNTAVASVSAASSTPTIQAPTNILIPLIGTVKSVSGDTLTISGKTASSTIAIAVSSDTNIVQEGVLKDAATYQADLEKFHQESDKLMQDPQQNQIALETLIAPSRNVETPLSLSHLSAGEQVIVFADGQNTDGSYTAFRISASSPTAL
jgi:hypothetical protein